MNNPSKRKTQVRTAILALLLVIGGMFAAAPLNHMFGDTLPIIRPVSAALGPNNNLGIDCALGASADSPNPFPTPITTKNSDGVIDPNCQWTGDVDGDAAATFDPLTSDTPELLPPPQIGGGFIADVIFTNMNVTINGFDITVSYDPHILDFVAIDQSGLTFGGNVGCPSTLPQCTLQLASSIDRVNGVIRLAQVLLKITVGPGGDTGNLSGVILFRLRFDVVGAGYTSLHFGPNVVTRAVGTQTGPDPHYTIDGSFSTQNIFNLVNSQPLTSTSWFNTSWTFSPNPEVPGSALTFTAVTSCSFCKGPLTYKWDFSSVDLSSYTAKIDKTGNVVTISAPPPLVDRVTLTVTNSSGTVFASATRLLPLVAQGTLRTLAVGVAGDVGGSWLGGVPSYSGSYTLCPAQSSSDFSVCSKPALPIPLGTTSQNKTAVVSYNYAGLYNSTLTITDSAPTWVSGPFTATTTFLVNVTGTPMVYTLGITSNETVAFVGHAVQLTATVVYNNNYPSLLRSTTFRYVFFWGDGTSQIISSGLAASVSHVYQTSAKFSVLVQAQETRTTILSKSRIQENGYTIMAVDAPITADFSTNPSTFQSGQTATFSATASGGTSTFTYSWAFGDGTTGTGASVTHTYANPGTYTVSLTITDSYGGSTVVTHSIAVTSPATQPTSSFPLVYIAGAGIAAAAILGALAFLLRRRRKGITLQPSPPTS